VQFRVLGDLEVVKGGEGLPLGGRKQRALLAALLLDANRVVPADVLVEALWGEEASTKAPANLHSLVSRLRRTLGAERIERHAGGYLLRVMESEVDLRRFERLRAEARLLPPNAASERLRLALDLWRGPPLADFTYDSWAGGEIARLEELRVAAIEERIDADLEAGRHKELIAELQGLVSEHPLREAFRRQLIVALYRSGRQAEALAAYQAARRMLDEELGLEPSPALRELEGAVLRQDPALDVAPARSPHSPTPVPSRRRGLLLVGASALLAFGIAASAAWWSNRGEGRHTEAVAAPSPKRQTTIEPQAARTQPKAKSTAVARRVPGPRMSTPKRTSPRHSKAPVTAPRSTTSQAQPPPPPPARAQQPPPPPPPPPLPAKEPVPVRITDNFDDGVLARDLWMTWTSGTGAEVAERNGRVEMTISADAVPGGEYNVVNVAIATTCRLLGDFDVRVEYELLDWPRPNGTAVQLAAFFNNSALTVGRQSDRWGENYVAWYVRTGNSLQTTDIRGALRIRRQNGQTITYHRVGNDWTAVRGFVTERAPNIGLQIFATGDNFAHQRVRIALDNFELTAAQPVC
jgi:DNA-binding SARP family transcriptional activator